MRKDSFVFAREEDIPGKKVTVIILDDGKPRDNVHLPAKLLADGKVQLLGSYSANPPLHKSKFRIVNDS